MIYCEYINIVLPKCTRRLINNVFWCDLFNQGVCDKHFPNIDGKTCDDCFDNEMRPLEGFEKQYKIN